MDNWFQKLCDKLTKHRWRKLICWSEGIEPREYHYKCKICRPYLSSLGLIFMTSYGLGASDSKFIEMR